MVTTVVSWSLHNQIIRLLQAQNYVFDWLGVTLTSVQCAVMCVQWPVCSCLMLNSKHFVLTVALILCNITKWSFFIALIVHCKIWQLCLPGLPRKKDFFELAFVWANGLDYPVSLVYKKWYSVFCTPFCTSPVLYDCFCQLYDFALPSRSVAIAYSWLKCGHSEECKWRHCYLFLN